MDRLEPKELQCIYYVGKISLKSLTTDDLVQICHLFWENHEELDASEDGYGYALFGLPVKDIHCSIQHANNPVLWNVAIYFHSDKNNQTVNLSQLNKLLDLFGEFVDDANLGVLTPSGKNNLYSYFASTGIKAYEA